MPRKRIAFLFCIEFYVLAVFALIPLLYFGFVLQEFETFIIKKFKFRVQIEKSINLLSVVKTDSTAFSKRLSSKAVISYSFIKSRFALLILIACTCHRKQQACKAYSWQHIRNYGKSACRFYVPKICILRIKPHYFRLIVWWL